MKIRILLADDHPMFRQTLRLYLESHPEFEVAGEAGDGQEAIAKARMLLPDVVCMDITMPGMDGIEAARRVLAVAPETRVIGLSAHADPHYAMEMLDAGAYGYVAKTEPAAEVVRAIRAVHNGRRGYLCPGISSRIADMATAAHSGELPLPRLSPRELQVLHLVAEGCSSINIAHSLHLATSTVEVHRRNIMRKVNLHSIAELTKYAIRNGIADG